ncbi:E3 ubiquitin-protein ligase TRIM62 [Eucyclogobius newberryi]|uniref:E3 ubiquitin-protein ligase TRIM62 n=1 Tax=Eucyclogobius newberryi TaxID=166745 RepID=UPI003B5BBB9C
MGPAGHVTGGGRVHCRLQRVPHPEQEHLEFPFREKPTGTGFRKEPLLSSLAEMSSEKGSGAPSAGDQGALQDATRLTLQASTEVRVQPFPRSPQLQRKLAKAALPAQGPLSKSMKELRAEKAKAEARIQSLEKRRADLAARSEMMKQQIHGRYEAMRAALKQDEQAAMETQDIDLKRTRAKLDQVLKTWNQHLDQVTKTISSAQKTLKDDSKATSGGEMEGKMENVSLKKSDGANIRLDEERFATLVHTLSNLCRQLRVELQRKTLLLDLLPVTVDAQTCHPQLTVTPEGSGLFCGAARSSTELLPLQFDSVCCALGSTPVSSGQGYWEVDLRCCFSGWAVGVAYGKLERKGQDKGCKLGRNRNSWCVEFRNGRLSAWHNDRHVACQRAGQPQLKRVGVWVHFDMDLLVFYDADTMGVLQSFSKAVMPMFDRAHHQLTEPLYPAVRLVKPDTQARPNHVEFCHSALRLSRF